ncbi:MAG: asparagine synthase-related protein, partial [Anaerolineae bacterium]
MLRAIRHRGSAGPDTRQATGIALGVQSSHSAASPEKRQITVSADGKGWAILNGRILNHAELEHYLEQRGSPLVDRSDADLLLALYRLQGTRCLDQMEGEFALVVWDGWQRRLFAARDRLGIHHLFYTIQDGTFYFGSEIKAILATGQVERRLDPHAIDQVLFMNCPVAPRTMFQGISALPAGHFLLVHDGHLNQQAYWDLEFAPATVGLQSEEEWRQQLLSLLRNAVHKRIPSDQSTGVYLSGGLDSSTVTALM